MSFKCLDFPRVLALLLLSVLDVCYSSAHNLLPLALVVLHTSCSPHVQQCSPLLSAASNLIFTISSGETKQSLRQPSYKSAHQTKFCSCSFPPKGGAGNWEASFTVLGKGERVNINAVTFPSILNVVLAWLLLLTWLLEFSQCYNNVCTVLTMLQCVCCIISVSWEFLGRTSSLEFPTLPSCWHHTLF